MRVIVTMYGGAEIEHSLEDYVRLRLRDETERGGAVETLEARANALATYFSRLVAILAKGGHLSAEQVFDTLPADLNVKAVRMKDEPLRPKVARG